MKLTLPILAVVFHLAAPYVSGGTITSQVSCSAGGVGINTVTDTGAFSCSVNVMNSVGATAHSSAQVSGGAFGVMLFLVATTEANDASAQSYTTASITATTSIFTDGPLRSGFVDLTFSGATGCIDCSPIAASASFDNYGTNWGGNGGCGGLGCNHSGPVIVPITLGDTYTVTSSANAQGLGSFGLASQSLGQAHSSLSLQFFEADGLTPVAWTEGTATPSVPEPSTFWLFTAALIVTCVVVRVRERKSTPC